MLDLLINPEIGWLEIAEMPVELTPKDQVSCEIVENFGEFPEFRKNSGACADKKPPSSGELIINETEVEDKQNETFREKSSPQRGSVSDFASDSSASVSATPDLTQVKSKILQFLGDPGPPQGPSGLIQDIQNRYDSLLMTIIHGVSSMNT